VVWACAWFGMTQAVLHVTGWYRWFLFTMCLAVGVLWVLLGIASRKLAWLCRREEEMVSSALYAGRLSVMPSQEMSDALRAMVMDPEIGEMQPVLQPLADYLEHVERVRNGAE
jgi:hypothetical protein